MKQKIWYIYLGILRYKQNVSYQTRIINPYPIQAYNWLLSYEHKQKEFKDSGNGKPINIRVI